MGEKNRRQRPVVAAPGRTHQQGAPREAPDQGSHGWGGGEKTPQKKKRENLDKKGGGRVIGSGRGGGVGGKQGGEGGGVARESKGGGNKVDLYSLEKQNFQLGKGYPKKKKTAT